MIKSQVDQTERIRLVVSLGFNTNRQDRFEMNGLLFDFSATHPSPEAIVNHAVQQAYILGQRAGRRQVQSEMKSALGIGEEEIFRM